MAYTVSFGQISKKVNSTAQGYTELASASCVLKESSDVLNPVFTFQGAFPETANYFYVSAFGRYYWIVGIVFVLGHWEISGKVDVLASFKAAIGSSAQIVLRCNTFSDGDIIDTEIPTLATPQVDHFASPLGFSAQGTYIVCIAGANGNKFYALDQSGWQALYRSVFTSQFLQDYTTIWDAIITDVQNAVLNPDSYIVNAKWIPFAISGGTAEPITLGFTGTGVSGRAVSPAFVWYMSTQITIPAHPQTAIFGNFVNGNRYRKINLFLPGYGNLAIDADALLYQNVIELHASCDISGILYYRVFAGNIDYCVSCNVGTDIGYTISKTGIANALTSVANGAAQGTAGFISSLGDAALSALPQVERACSGGSASIVTASPNFTYSVMYYLLDTDKRLRIGRAYNKMIQISACSGYIKCENATVECTGTQSEIEEINNYLDSGFYYE